MSSNATIRNPQHNLTKVSLFLCLVLMHEPNISAFVSTPISSKHILFNKLFYSNNYDDHHSVSKAFIATATNNLEEELNNSRKKSKNAISQSIGKEKYEFGDFTRWLDNKARENGIYAALGILIVSTYISMEKNFSNESLYCLIFIQIGIIYDNITCAIGKYIRHDTKFFFMMHKMRFVLHGMGIPLLTIPLMEAVVKFQTNALIPLDPEILSMLSLKLPALILSFSAYEMCHCWTQIDSQKDMEIIDSQHFEKKQKNHLAGTVKMSLAPHVNRMRLILPTIVVVMLQILVGILLLALPAGSILLTSGMITLITAASVLPEFQLLGEHIFIASVWYVLAIL